MSSKYIPHLVYGLFCTGCRPPARGLEDARQRSLELAPAAQRPSSGGVSKPASTSPSQFFSTSALPSARLYPFIASEKRRRPCSHSPIPGVAYQRRKLRRETSSGWPAESGPTCPATCPRGGASPSSGGGGSSQSAFFWARERPCWHSSHATTAPLKQKPGNWNSSCTVISPSELKTGRRPSAALAPKLKAPAVQCTYVVSSAADRPPSFAQGSASSEPSAKTRSPVEEREATRPRPRMTLGALSRSSSASRRLSVASMNFVGVSPGRRRYTLPSSSSFAKADCRKADEERAEGGEPAAACASSADAMNSMHVFWRSGLGGSRAVIHGRWGTTHAIRSRGTPSVCRRKRTASWPVLPPPSTQ
mmetsp:Transcript_27576/g.89720  ORF Transcript_27576/g.89720 Transcript_27576/m.89720 type:complete len:362 (+) Transcript_27576:3-1088(+)